VTESMSVLRGANIRGEKLSQPLLTPLSDEIWIDSSWRALYLVAGITALLVILLVPAEVIIGLLPGVEKVTAYTSSRPSQFALPLLLRRSQRHQNVLKLRKCPSRSRPGTAS
jgi:hypothetical protein